MNEIPVNAWFYTREGERFGPVEFTELRTKAAGAALDPRLDMAWKQGMPAWLPAGEIEGLFEKRAAPEPREAPAPAADPYAPPDQASVAEEMSREGDWPGARRRSYLFMTIVFPFLWNSLFAFAAVFLGNQLGPEIMGAIGLVAAIIPMIAGIYFGLMRLVNLGMTRWWFLGFFVPLLNFWVGYRCFACPAGYAYHKKLDGPGIALAIVYWLFLALAALAAVALFALMFGLIDSPEIQEQLREAIRALRPPSAKP